MSSLASEVDIANLALTDLGAKRITALTDDTENARQINVIFEHFRDEVLRAHPWNFATSRILLNQTANTPLFGWSYEHQIPGDVLSILSTEAYDVKFIVEGDKVLSNDTPLNVKVISRITDTTKWSTDFVTCFSARLSAELAYSIANSASLQERKFALYQEKLRLAKGRDAVEGTPPALVVDEWVISRFPGRTDRSRL